MGLSAHPERDRSACHLGFSSLLSRPRPYVRILGTILANFPDQCGLSFV